MKNEKNRLDTQIKRKGKKEPHEDKKDFKRNLIERNDGNTILIRILKF